MPSANAALFQPSSTERHHLPPLLSSERLSDFSSLTTKCAYNQDNCSARRTHWHRSS